MGKDSRIKALRRFVRHGEETCWDNPKAAKKYAGIWERFMANDPQQRLVKRILRVMGRRP